jgi:HTH-type transcriptional regulator/antitoxin HigA
MDIRPIRTTTDYEAALERIEVILDAQPDSDEGIELDLLATLVEAYERRRFPIEPLDPVEFLAATLEARGVGQAELARVLGSRSRASEVLTRKRPLTLKQIRRISKALNIPAQPLIAEYELSA